MVRTIVGLITVGTAVVTALWFFWDTRATAAGAQDQAVENEKELRGQAEQIQLLTDIHTKQQAAEEAERRLREKLCAAGKLKGEDCAGLSQ